MGEVSVPLLDVSIVLLKILMCISLGSMLLTSFCLSRFSFHILVAYFASKPLFLLMICSQLIVIVLAVLYLCGASSDIEEYWRCFDVLGVSPTDSMATIKSKYRQLALIYHPDRLNTQVSSLEEPFRAMEDINEAYDCVIRSLTPRSHETDIPRALSERATYLVEQVSRMRDSIPEVQRNDFVVEVKEYFGSEDLPGDVAFLVGQYWSKSDAETLQMLVRTVLIITLMNCVVCIIGIIAITYFTFKFLWWVARCMLAIFRCLFVSYKVKAD